MVYIYMYIYAIIYINIIAFAVTATYIYIHNIYTYVHVYVCMYVCTYVCIYVYTHIYIYIYIYRSGNYYFNYFKGLTAKGIMIVLTHVTTSAYLKRGFSSTTSTVTIILSISQTFLQVFSPVMTTSPIS